jgi:hypothetical protein
MERERTKSDAPNRRERGQPFSVIRFIAHNDDIVFETRNIFCDEKLVLRRNENPVADRVNARRHRVEL